MPDNDPHSLGKGLVRIHLVITRGIEVARQRTHACAHGEPADTSLAAGFADYLQALVSVVHAHHTAEDEIAYPSFRDRFPDAPWALIAEEHAAIAPLLDQLGDQAGGIRRDGSPDAWERAAGTLDKLADVWAPHYQREQVHFTLPALANALSLEEQTTMLERIAAHNQDRAKPDYLVVPFILYNLEGDDRRGMAAAFPPVVTEQLVPVVWQDKWSPMKPFLLG